LLAEILRCTIDLNQCFASTLVVTMHSDAVGWLRPEVSEPRSAADVCPKFLEDTMAGIRFFNVHYV